MEFELKTEYIELIKLLKLCGIADSGAEAKQMVEEGLIQVNGADESRKRYKVRKGDLITANEFSLKVV